MTTKSQSLRKKSKFQVTDKTILGSIFIILSGVIVILDKIFNLSQIEFSNNHGFADSQTLIWTLGQTFAPIFIIIGSNLKPYKFSYLIPIFCYSIQLFFVLDTGSKSDDYLFWFYVAGVFIFVTVFILIVSYIINRLRDIRNLKMDLMESLIEVDKEIIDGKK